MGIISLNEKRSSTNPTHTTGKEKSFFTTDNYGEILGDAKIIIAGGQESMKNYR